MQKKQPRLKQGSNRRPTFTFKSAVNALIKTLMSKVECVMD